jgi:hypothetical protein
MKHIPPDVVRIIGEWLSWGIWTLTKTARDDNLKIFLFPNPKNPTKPFPDNKWWDRVRTITTIKHPTDATKTCYVT